MGPRIMTSEEKAAKETEEIPADDPPDYSDQDMCVNQNQDDNPKRKGSIWQTAKNKIKITPKDATPVDWKLIGLVFISMVRHVLLIRFSATCIISNIVSNLNYWLCHLRQYSMI